jgi:hypothetical protein
MPDATTSLALPLLHPEGMRAALLALVALSLAVAPALAQVAPPPAKSDRTPVEHGAQPNAGEVRPGNAEGDAPSAAAGDLVTRQERRVFGLPITTTLVLAGVLVVLLAVAGVVIPNANRRRRARGGGTYGDR